MNMYSKNNSKITDKYIVNIITDTSRAYYTPCEIQSVVITASFTAWVMVTVVVVISVVVLVVAVIMIGAVIDTSAIGMRAGVLISNVAVDLDALTDIKRGVSTNINVDVLVDENVKTFVAVLAALEFDMLEGFRC